MSRRPSGFRRMVIGLPQSVANHGAVEAAANLAEFLDIELLATFIADAALLGLAEVSAVRELRTLDQGWQPIELAQITRDLEIAADRARRRFVESVKSRSIKTSFDVVAGAEVIAALLRADDIIAIIEPAHPGESITRQFTDLLAAAFAAAAAVLVVPRRIACATGPIVAAAASPEDPCIRAALEIAAALRERLIIVTLSAAPLPRELLAAAADLGVTVEHSCAPGTGTESSGLRAAALKARLRVVSRGFLTADGEELFASLHGIPLLVIEPPPSEPAAEAVPA